MSLITAIKHDTVTLMMYSFVIGFKHGKPEATTEEAIDRFYSQFDLTEKDYMKKESARVTISNIAKRVYRRDKCV